MGFVVSMPSFEVRFFSKLCLGWYVPGLHSDAMMSLEMITEEAEFVFKCLQEAVTSPDLTSEAGYTATELLSSVYNITTIGRNRSLLLERGITELLVILAELPNCPLQKFVLLLLWDFLIYQESSAVTVLHNDPSILKITFINIPTELKLLHQCVCFLLEKDSNSGIIIKL